MKAPVATIASIVFIIASISQAFAQASVGAPRVTDIKPVKVGKIFKYGAKFFCLNPSPSLVAGEYFTDISVHNPQDHVVTFTKFVLITQAEGEPIGPVGVARTVSLSMDQGFHIDCTDIITNLSPSPSPTSGYVVINSGEMLDVTAVYEAVFATGRT
jgi:hypothetical protein